VYGNKNFANNFNSNKTNTIGKSHFNRDVSDVINLINLIPSSPKPRDLNRVRSRHQIKICIIFTGLCQVNEILQHFTRLNPRLSRQIDHGSFGYLFHLLFDGNHVNS